MNNFKICYLLLLTIMYFTSCNDDDILEDPDQDIYFGKAEALLNGESWISEVRSTYSVLDSNDLLITLDRFENGFLRSAFSLRSISSMDRDFQALLVSSPNTNCDRRCASFSTGFDDQIGDFYDLDIDDTLEDWVIIDSFNNETQEFWGRFQASLIINSDFPKTDIFPDTLRFENGSFNGRINE